MIKGVVIRGITKSNMNLMTIKKLCRKNKVVYIFSRIVYLPLKKINICVKTKINEKEGLRKLKERNDIKSTIFYFGIPVHRNLGDFAQMYCILEYFKKYWYEYEVLGMKTYSTYSNKYIKELKKKIRSNDLIFFQSGYCTTDEHLDHIMHKIILEEFPDNRVIFLPQTVSFKNEVEKKEQ